LFRDIVAVLEELAMTETQQPPTQTRPGGTWAFLTNHAYVLLCIARDPQSRARDIAERVGITERAAQRILADLIADGYVTRTKVGRRNHYKVNRRGHLRHPAFRNLAIGPLLEALNTANWPSAGRARKKSTKQVQASPNGE
jgi:DNA-binding MarR family transcriptional regulator